jgi:vacuolar-type H+-ATPase subunit H
LITSSENEIKQLKINHENILRTQKDEVISSAFKEKEQKWRREINELEEKLKEEAQLVINNLKKENSDLKEKV